MGTVFTVMADLMVWTLERNMKTGRHENECGWLVLGRLSLS